MKKIVSVLLLSALLLVSCGSAAEETSLYTRGTEIVSLLDELAGSEEYLGVYTASAEILEILDAVAKGDHTSPAAVYEITIPAEMILALSEAEIAPGMSEELRQNLLNRTQATVTATVNSRNGVNVLAATSVCTVGKTFVNSSLTAATIYLYTFEDATPVIVTFTPGDDHTVSASGTFLISEDIDTSSAETVSAFFEEYGATARVVPAE